MLFATAGMVGVFLLSLPRAKAQPSYARVGQTNFWDVYAPPDWYQANAVLLTSLLPYLDAMTARIRTDFGYDIFPLPGGQPRLALVFDLAINGASTGTPASIGLTGITVEADSVGSAVFGVPNFLYHIYSLHETINTWTGLLASGWVWADGSPLWAGLSPFPNAMDAVITGELGYTGVSNLQQSLNVVDAGSKLFFNIQKTYGWPALQKFFSYVQRSGITDWGAYAEPYRSAITAWLMSAACGVDLLDRFNAAILALSGLTIPLSSYRRAQVQFPV